MKREDILKIYEAGPDAVVDLVENLIRGFTSEIRQLEQRVKELENQLNRNRRNSSKPPSSDGFKKPNPKSLRESGRRSVGGQKGHPGRTLMMLDEPDHIIVHPVNACSCGYDLTATPLVRCERRQEWDLPPLRMEVTEHQAQMKCCPACGLMNKASFPTEIAAPVQYGTGVKSLAVYLNQYQLLPYDRIQELFHDVFGHELSPATCVSANEYLYDRLDTVEANIAERIRTSDVAHFDETGMRVEGKRHWLHVASTHRYTHYSVHRKRGQEGMDEADILPGFSGTALHDAWKSYWSYACHHALCNAHHLRELTFIYEQENQKWAKAMIELLLEIKQSVASRQDGADTLDAEEITAFVRRFDRIIELGLAEDERMNPPSKETVKKKGPAKQSTAKNLLDRLLNHRLEVLAFMCDFRIPFDNNQAERDVRMTKVQQKISGTFRSQQGAKTFCRIRGYISTLKKHSLSALRGIEAALQGKSILPL
ncbi:MAG: IS66 family transposase [Paenibacillaceae bacterium]